MKWTLPSRPLQSTVISTSNTKVGPPYGASNIDVFSMFLTRNPQLYNKVHIMVVSLEWGVVGWGYCNPHNSSLVALSCLSTIPHGLSGNWSSPPLNGPLHQFLALRDTRSCVGSTWTTEPCNLIPSTCCLSLFIYIFAWWFQLLRLDSGEFHEDLSKPHLTRYETHKSKWSMSHSQSRGCAEY